MTASASGESVGGRMVVKSSDGLRCQSSDALTEWRSSEQVENGTPSTSPSYWDIDDGDDDGGLKPSDLYGLFTWKIEKFSQINTKELKSDTFEVGDYKWYILIYPQGCDVFNHLSLFLCVGNHDKLLPGWSHSAQFTIAVVNKDSKKSKYSDTLHRFCKKEHDWGWKRFMELSKVSDGFVDTDTLIIKAQVQVIREKVDRPFRCLDRQYRRELVRVYLTNVEQIFRRFIEERRGKLGKLIEDKAKWSSFCAFWLGMDQNARRRMSKEKKDMILKLAVKHFFIDKEVTSTLAMDSLYSGLKAVEDQNIRMQGKAKLLEATTHESLCTGKDMDSLHSELKSLEAQSKGQKGKAKSVEVEGIPAPVIRIENDMFVLVDDVLFSLERAAVEPLPPKDDKGPQNRTKDGGIGEDFNRDSLEHDERRLTELGRRTVEIFVLTHIFSNKIEVAYQEAVSLKRQEELIREEEAAWLIESEQKAKRGAAEKDKKSKKKQGKQKRNNRKGKDKSKDDKQALESLSAEGGEDMEEPQITTEKDDTVEDLSDVSDIVECAVDILQPNLKEREASPVNWDMDASEMRPPTEASGGGTSSVSIPQNGVDRHNSSVLADRFSARSTDSVSLPKTNGSNKSNSVVNYKSEKSPTRGKNQRGKITVEERTGPNEVDNRKSDPAKVNSLSDAFPNRKMVESNKFEGAVTSLQDRTKWPELNAFKKEDKAPVPQRKQNNRDKTSVAPSVSKIPPKTSPSVTTSQPTPDMTTGCPTDVFLPRKTSLNEQQQTEKATSSVNTLRTPNASVVDSTMTSITKQVEKPAVQQSVGLSRPSSAPIIPSSFAASPSVSTVQVAAPSAPVFPRSVRATSPAFVSHSYRNPLVNTSTAFSQQPTLGSNNVFVSRASERMESYGQPWMDSLQRDVNRSSMFDSPPSPNGIPHFDLYRPMNNGSHGHFPSQLSVGTSGRQVQSTLADEFPHLDIINDLLDDEQVIGRSHGSGIFPGTDNGPTTLFNDQFDRYRSYPDDSYQQNYGFTRTPQGNSIPCMNGDINSVVSDQWQLLNPDLSSLGLTSPGVDGYSYNIPEYLNMARGVNGYTMFPSSNGH